MEFVKPTQPDAIHVQRLRELEDSAGWRMVCARIQQMAERETAAALNAADWTAMQKACGAREALLRVLDLPKILRDEAKGKLARARSGEGAA